MQHVQQLERDWQKNTEKEMEKRQDLQQHFGICIESVCVNAACVRCVVVGAAVVAAASVAFITATEICSVVS